jgi:hypothetical protein
VAVHGALGRAGGDQARLGGGAQDVLEGQGHVVAVLAAVGQVAGLHERQARQGGDADVEADRLPAEATVCRLVGRQPSQPPVNGLLLVGRDLVAAELVGVGGQAGARCGSGGRLGAGGHRDREEGGGGEDPGEWAARSGALGGGHGVLLPHGFAWVDSVR